MEAIYSWIMLSPPMAATVVVLLLILLTAVIRHWKALRTALWVAQEGQYQAASAAFVQEIRSYARERGVATSFDRALAQVAQLGDGQLTIGHVLWAIDVAEDRLSPDSRPPNCLR